MRVDGYKLSNNVCLGLTCQSCYWSQYLNLRKSLNPHSLKRGREKCRGKLLKMPFEVSNVDRQYMCKSFNSKIDSHTKSLRSQLS